MLDVCFISYFTDISLTLSFTNVQHSVFRTKLLRTDKNWCAIGLCNSCSQNRIRLGENERFAKWWYYNSCHLSVCVWPKVKFCHCYSRSSSVAKLVRYEINSYIIWPNEPELRNLCEFYVKWYTRSFKPIYGADFVRFRFIVPTTGMISSVIARARAHSWWGFVVFFLFYLYAFIAVKRLIAAVSDFVRRLKAIAFNEPASTNFDSNKLFHAQQHADYQLAIRLLLFYSHIERFRRCSLCVTITIIRP